MPYTEVNIKHRLEPDLVQILIAFLGEAGFESFVEDQADRLLAYTTSFDSKAFDALLHELPFAVEGYEHRLIADQNWNAVWESQYEPVVIDTFCAVRAPFHKPFPEVDYDLLIEPKMSFGTAHHQTTYLMIESLRQTTVKGCDLLDMGCGTGVLAILAEQMGAHSCLGIDTDTWAYENTLENIQRNQCSHTQALLGDANLLNSYPQAFDIILANINRNILIRDMAHYVRSLRQTGQIFFSGFYESDLLAVRQAAEAHGLSYSHHLERQHWVAAKFVRA